MVDSTSTQNLVNQHIFTEEQNNSRTNSATDKWWINMLAVVKLRQKGTTLVSKLPSGVFRHMLEYKFPIFSFRYSDPYEPIEWEQDRHFPAIETLSYDNYLVSINEFYYNDYIFKLADGFDCGCKELSNQWTFHQTS